MWNDKCTEFLNISEYSVHHINKECLPFVLFSLSILDLKYDVCVQNIQRLIIHKCCVCTKVKIPKFKSESKEFREISIR